MKIKNKKRITIGLGIAVILITVGSVGALNGWFGGGASIPSDTFTRGLVGYWPMDEGSGYYAYDGSGNSNTGTLGGYAGATSSDPKWASGKVGGALSFDGVNDYVNAGNDASLRITGPITLEAWAKFSNLTDTNQQIVAKWETGSNQRAYSIGFNKVGSNYYGVFTVSNDGTWGNKGVTDQYSVGTTALTAGIWYHIVGTYDMQNTKIYVNAVNEDTDAFNKSIKDSSASIEMGQLRVNGSPAQFFNGTIDEVRIYNRALSAEEIRYHYNRGGPVAHWTFDEGHGTTTYDMTDNNNDGVLGDGVTATSMPSFVAGKYGTALSFDGTDDYVDAGNGASLDITQELTLEVWVKRLSTNRFDYLISKFYESGAITEYSYILSMQTNNKIRLDVWNSSDTSTILEGSTITDTNWHYLVGTYKYITAGTSEMKLYLDGVFNAQRSDAVAIASYPARPLWLAGWNHATAPRWANVVIDDVRIYNYARTADEITLDYNAGFAAHFGPQSSCDEDPGSCMDLGLVGYWDLEEGQGTTAYDKSEYNNDGTLTNGPRWTTGIKPLSGGVSGGGALQFDGTDDYVDLGTKDFFGSGQQTIELWARPNFNPPSARGFLFAHTGSPADNRVYIIQEGSPLGRIFYISGDNTFFTLLPSTEYSANQWLHIVVTRDYDNQKFDAWVNGVQKFTNQAAVWGSTVAYNSRIGAIQGTPESFDGLIDEVRIYNRALSADEIRYHYNRGGPIAHWAFDEGNGTTTYDSTDNSNDGTFMTAASSPTWTTGKYGTALEFDGTDDYIDVGDEDDLIGLGYTYEFWVRSDSLSGFEGILDKIEDAGDYNGMLIARNADKLEVYSDAGSTDCSATLFFTANVWIHAVVVIDISGNRYIYKNGLLVDTGTAATVTDNNESFYIGQQDVSSRFFGGSIDDVRIYNYARTPSQIQQDYNQGMAAHFGPVGEGIATKDCDNDPASCMDYGLVGYLPFDEGSGSLAYDASENSNDGTLTNGPRWTTGINPLSGGISGGGALSFDGKDDYVDAGNDASLDFGSGDFSIEIWTKPGNYADNRFVLGKGSLGSWPGFDFNVFTANRTMNFRVYDGTNTVNSGQMSLPIGDWQHIVGIKDGSRLKLYKNGTKEKDVNASTLGDINTTQHLYLGKSSFGLYYNGLIDEVRIYNRALSAEEIRYHYNRGGPVAYWKFDEGYGTTTYDETNNNNDGTFLTAASSPTWTTGKYGSALFFDGTDDYVDCGSINPTEFTFEAWVNRTISGVAHTIIGTNSANGREFRIFSDNKLQLVKATVVIVGSSVDTVPSGEWVHAVVTYDSPGNYAFYINGVLSGSGTNLQTFSSGIAQIGIETTTTRPFNGLIDDVRIYNYVRTPEQILQDYNAGLSSHFK